MNILLTGFTGNIGQAVAEALADARLLAVVRDASTAPRRANVEFVAGSLEDLSEIRTEEIEVIIHGAANTSFTAPLETLRETNVHGTARMLAFAARCPRLQRFIHLSTTCVSGTTAGFIRYLVDAPRASASLNQTLGAG